MEFELNENNPTRILSLGELGINASNWTANLTRLASEVANYSLNFLDVGLDLTTPPPLSAADVPSMHDAHDMHDTFANVTPTNTEPAIEDDEIRLTHAPQLTEAAMVQVYVLSVMAFFSLLGNVLTMWNIYKTRISRRKSRHSSSAIYSLIFHLSIADILVTGFCIIGEAAWRYTVQWLADEITCKLVKLFQMFSLYLSTYVLVLIGVDRYIAVKYPMKSLNMAKRCHRLLGGTYVLSLILSLPQFFIFHVASGPFIEEFHQCVTHGFYTAKWQEQLYTTFSLVSTFLLPLCILFGTYLSTFRTISSSEKIFQGSKLAAYSTNNKSSSYTNRQRLIHKAKMKSLRISVVIIFAFLICWTPYYVMMMIFMYANPDDGLREDLNSAIFFFGMSNSLVNPLIYGAFHLCPSGDKTAKCGGGGGNNNNNGGHALSRGDSQRTMLSAVTTQFDGNRSRHTRNYRQSAYYRSHSQSNGNSYKDHEQVSLLNVGSTPAPTPTVTPTPTPTIIGRRCTSVRSPHPHHFTQVHSLNLQPPRDLSLLDNGKNPPSMIVLNYDDHKGGVAALRANSSASLSGLNGVNKILAPGNAVSTSTTGFNAANESVSSV